MLEYGIAETKNEAIRVAIHLRSRTQGIGIR